MSPRLRRATACAVAVVGASALGGCAQPVTFSTDTIACSAGDDAEPADGVVLMAQSVPTATWVPCLRSVPLGWHISQFDARNDSARFWLDSERYGEHALEVKFTATCDTERTTEIPSEREQMRRFERVEQVSPRYVGARHYVFDGGCITVLFDLPGSDRAEPLGLASQGLGVLSRDDVQAHVREETGGRLELDPPGTGGAP